MADTSKGRLSKRGEELTDKKQVIYEQNCQSFRQLNNVMWQVPVLAMTLTGGIWFGISTLRDNPGIAFSLWLLAAIANLIFVIVLWRIRAWVMEWLLVKMHEYEGGEHVKGSYIVISAFSVLLIFAMIISIYGAFNTYDVEFSRSENVSRIIVEPAADGVRVFCE